MFFNYVNAIELIHVPTTWNYSPTNCLVPVAPALEAVPLGGDGYASGFSGDDGTGLQLMGGPFPWNFPQEFHKFLWKRLFAVDPIVQLHVLKVPRNKVVIQLKHINSFYMNELSPIYNGTSKFSLRLTLVCLLVMANNCIWVIEQPRHSLAGRWKRFEWMVNYVAWVP